MFVYVSVCALSTYVQVCGDFSLEGVAIWTQDSAIELLLKTHLLHLLIYFSYYQTPPTQPLSSNTVSPFRGLAENTKA